MNNPRLPEIAADAVACEITTGFPAEVTVAQCAIESDWLEDAPHDNCFGLKARPGFPSFLTPTREVIQGKSEEEDLAFESFPTLQACFERHADLITQAPIYAAAWSGFQQSKNLSAFVRAFSAHYASDPAYSAKVLQLAGQPDVVAAVAAARRAAWQTS